MRIYLLPILAACPVFAHGAKDVSSTRAPTPQETASFNDFYRKNYAGAGVAASLPATAGTAIVQPVFEIVRPPGRRDWSVTARVDAAPRHTSAAVCQMSRSVFSYRRGAPKSQRWSADPSDRQLVWLARTPACVVPASPLLLEQALPDADLVNLIGQQAALLQRARLLMAGNTQCAHMRSLAFQPRALGVEASTAAAPTMYRITYESDRNSTVQVAVRKSGTELTAWNVSCIPS